MVNMKKLRINIAGTPYNIATDNDLEYAADLAQSVDLRIQTIMQAGNFISPSQATVLALLEYADEAAKTAIENEKLKSQLKEYLADAAQAKAERDVLKREIAKMKKNGGGEQ